VALERTAQTIGLRERRVAAPGVTALDLCADATERLIAEMGLDATSIDAVIFVTQTPDHSQPNNASLLHGRLGLSKSAPAYDLSLGCSGWVYGLHQASLLCAHGGAARVLLCAGDTLSRLTNPGDRSADPLFGDAGSATLIEKTGRSAPWHFVLGADGSGAQAIIVKQGGARQPAGNLAEVTDEEGNRRHDANLAMNGPDVFSFTLREVPAAVQSEARTPMGVVEKYGNQSSASIPSAMIDGLGDRLSAGPLKVAGCGYGVGLSWGAFAGELSSVSIAPILPFPR
jgi:3-oxoacyl-[acyl-carrier-protein] synthase-3